LSDHSVRNCFLAEREVKDNPFKRGKPEGISQQLGGEGNIILSNSVKKVSRSTKLLNNCAVASKPGSPGNEGPSPLLLQKKISKRDGETAPKNVQKRLGTACYDNKAITWGKGAEIGLNSCLD